MGDNSFMGVAKAGLGEGAYYVKLYADKFEEVLDFLPFPGTLNISVNPEDVKALTKTNKYFIVEAFKKRGKIFGAVYCYPVIINDDIESAIIMPVRARHDDDVIELIAEIDLRSLYNINDGDPIKVSEYEE